MNKTRLLFVIAVAGLLTVAFAAPAGAAPKVTLCHISSTAPYASTITVNNTAVDPHMKHGDYLGQCSTLEVKKVTEPAADPGKFDLKINGTTRATDVSNGGTTGARAVTPGSTNSASEAAGTGTDLADYNSSYQCKDGSTVIASGSGTATGSLPTAVAGKNIICTFTNQRKANVQLKKHTAPTGDGSLWNFVVTDGSATTYDSFTDESAPFDSGTINVTPGFVEMDEWAGTGTDFDAYKVSVACTDNGAPLTPTSQGLYDAGGGQWRYYVYFPVADGHYYACHFTNTQFATVQVKKDTAPTADGSLWNFVVTDGSATTYDSFTDESVPFDSGALEILTPTAIEIDEWAGTGADIGDYAVSVACTDDGSPLTPTTEGYYDAGGGQWRYYVYFPAVAGHEYVCEFTNTQSRAFTGNGGNNDAGDIIYFAAYGLDRMANFDVNEATQSGAYAYLDDNGDYYDVAVSCVSISGDTAFFAGPVANATQSSWNGLFLLAKVVDGSPDAISASFVVADPCSTLGTVDPADGPFTLDAGGITVISGQ